MSKYVRTTDGKIVSLCGITQDSINVSAEGKVLYVSDRLNPLHVYRIPYVSKSDDIRKLFDHLVVIEKDNSVLPRIIHRCFGAFILDRCEREGLQRNELEIYGSIWVNGDLIKVAKMNEKGEFELL